MQGAGRERGKEVRKRPVRGAIKRKCAKDVKNRGNELNDLLQTQDLASFRMQNELKTNVISSAKTRKLHRKSGYLVALFASQGWLRAWARGGLAAGFLAAGARYG